MPSAEAMEYLIQSSDDWERYRAQTNSNYRDLKLAFFEDANLRGRKFDGCDLTGTVFDGCNLDGASFCQSILDKVTFVDCSMVACRFTDTVLSDSKIKSSVMRSCVIDSVAISNLSIEELSIEFASIRKSSLNDVKAKIINITRTEIESLRVEDAQFEELKIVGSIAENSSFIRVLLLRSEFDSLTCKKCLLHEVAFHEMDLRDTSFLYCELSKVVITKSKCTRVNFQGSTISRVDLSFDGFEGSGLLGVSLVDCVIPSQLGKVSILGKYLPSPQLMRQPVQDIKGIDPYLRREIADAQYLVELQRRATLASQLVALRAWGMTSNFGQSARKLLLFTISTVLIQTLTMLTLFIYTSYDFQLVSAEVQGVSYREFLRELLIAIRDSIAICASEFVGISDIQGDDWTKSSIARAIRVTCRITGLLLLGVWISLVANKLGKLSSQ